MRHTSASETPSARPSVRGRKRRTAVRVWSLGAALCSWALFLGCGGGRSGMDDFALDGAIGGSPAGGSAGRVGGGGSGGTAGIGGKGIGGQPAGGSGGFPTGGFGGFPTGGFGGFPTGGAPPGGSGGGPPMPAECLTCAVTQCPAATQCFTNATCLNGTVCTITTCNTNQGLDFICVLGCFGGDINAATQAFSAVACISQSCPGPCIGN